MVVGKYKQHLKFVMSASAARRTFIEPVTSHVLCPMCRNVFTDPVMNVACGHTYCLVCIESTGVHRDGKTYVRCPDDRKECLVNELVVNRSSINVLYKNRLL